MSKRSVAVLVFLAAALAGGVGVRVGMSLVSAPTLQPEGEDAPTAVYPSSEACRDVCARTADESLGFEPSTGPTGRVPADAGVIAPVARLEDVLEDRGFGTDSARLVNDALVDRVIDPNERAMLGTLLPNLTPEQQRALTEQIARAVVDGGISVGE